MNLIPEDADNWSIWHAFADEMLSSLAYAIRCYLSQEAQEAVWAARRAYEAADQATLRILDIRPGGAIEAQIISHVIVQRELGRQYHDLVQLLEGKTYEVQCQAFKDELLTEDEISLLAT